ETEEQTSFPLPVRPLGCVKVFFESSAGPAQVAAVRERLTRNRDVKSFRFVSREQPFATLKKKLPGLVKGLRRNPLPDAFEAQPQRGRLVWRIEQSLRSLPGVENVNSG